MKKINLVLLSLIIFSVSAQELDEEFLESLPDDIKEDLKEKQESRVMGSEETYRPYLYSSKLSQAEELLTLKGRLEKDLLELERRLNTDSGFSNEKDLVLYGSDFLTLFKPLLVQ